MLRADRTNGRTSKRVVRALVRACACAYLVFCDFAGQLQLGLNHVRLLGIIEFMTVGIVCVNAPLLLRTMDTARGICR